MGNLVAKINAWQAVAVGVAIIGCTTALAITGHVSGDTAVNTLVLVGGATAGITGAHVGGTVATNNTGGPTPVSSPAGVAPPPQPPVQPAAETNSTAATSPSATV